MPFDATVTNITVAPDAQAEPYYGNDCSGTHPAKAGMSDVRDWHDTDAIHAEQGQGYPFAAAVRATRMPMIVTDPRRDDNPIVFANAAFLALTGYDHDEVIGRNCRLLQGRDTDSASVAAIRAAVEGRHDISIDLLNYRKNGTP